MRRFCLLSGLVGVVLAGCQNDNPSMLIDLGPKCPSTAVLADAVTVTKFKPGVPANAGMMFTAEMSQAQVTCDYDMMRNTLSVDLSFAVKGARGPAAAGADPPLDFFVAVVDIDGNLLAKKVYQNQPDLGNKPNAQWTQRINNFSVPMAQDKRPYDYEILTGFQLTPEELAFNRAPRPIPQPRP